MPVTFQNARKVERPKVNRVSQDASLVIDLLPFVEGARDEQIGVVLDTNDAKGLRRALRKAGRALPDGAVTVRFSADSAKDGEGAVTFWTSALVARKPATPEKLAERAAKREAKGYADSPTSPVQRPEGRRGRKTA